MIGVAEEAPRTRAGRTQRLDLTLWLSYGFSALAVTWLAFMLVALVMQSLPAWHHAGIGYLTGKRWFFRTNEFGILPMVYGSGVVAAVGIAIASVLGVGGAVFLEEFMPRSPRVVCRAMIELLAGVPSVVYGLLGMLLLRNWIYHLLAHWHPPSGDTLLTAGILLGIMVVPTVMTLSVDALGGVPASRRQAARALGLNRTEVVLAVGLPEALPGLCSAVLLGLGRAFGETVAIFLVIGRQDNQWSVRFPSLHSLVASGQTLTSKLGGPETFIAYSNRLHWAAMMGLGVVLLALVLGITLAGAALRRWGTRHA
jgi:phosphate transport system permease protein